MSQEFLVKRIQYDGLSDGGKKLIDQSLVNRSIEQTALLTTGRLGLFVQTGTLFLGIFASVAFISYLGILGYALAMLPIVLYLAHIDRQLGENASEMATLEASMWPGAFAFGHDISQITTRAKISIVPSFLLSAPPVVQQASLPAKLKFFRTFMDFAQLGFTALDPRGWRLYRAMQIGVCGLNLIAIVFGCILFALDIPVIGGFHLPTFLFWAELVVSIVFSWFQLRSLVHLRAKDLLISVFVISEHDPTRILAEAKISQSVLGGKGFSRPVLIAAEQIQWTMVYEE